VNEQKVSILYLAKAMVSAKLPTRVSEHQANRPYQENGTVNYHSRDARFLGMYAASEMGFIPIWRQVALRKCVIYLAAK